MKKLLYLFILSTSLLLSCEEKLEQEIAKEFPDGTPYVIHHIKWQGNNKIIAKKTRYYPNGNKHTEGSLKNNKKHGKWTIWFIEGKKQIEEEYSQGRLNGEFKQWYKSEEFDYTAEYKNGIPHGEWIYYDTKGNKLKKVTYEDGKKIKEHKY